MSLGPATTSKAPTENLAGLVERVTFHNEDNGFCVLRLKARGQRDLITVIGHAAMISAGEWIQAAGTGPAMRAFAYTLSFARKALGRPAIRSMITSFNRSACHG